MKRIITTLIIAVGLAGPLLMMPSAASADVGVVISADFGPPPLLYYPQPLCPGAGFIWTPGYWAYSDDGYFWVPGTWVLAPAVGLLWTPGWWGWHDSRYWWHGGYWGPRVGYYGGIHYGHGYDGDGYHGGYWRNRDFYYNRDVSNVNPNLVRNTYYQQLAEAANVNRVSYNGGTGGIATQPTAEQQAFARQQHYSVTEAQMEQERAAGNDPAQRWSANHSEPQIVATPRPGEFNGTGVVQMDQKQTVHLDPPVAHSTPGRPSFQTAQHTEGAPVVRPMKSAADMYQPTKHVVVPDKNAFSSEPRVQQPRPVQIGTPRERGPVNGTFRAPRNPARPEVKVRHKEKTGGHPPH
ncbi:MAG: YXWGXW repeat-containing protein [Gammaproteobacteria bacterium]